MNRNIKPFLLTLCTHLFHYIFLSSVFSLFIQINSLLLLSSPPCNIPCLPLHFPSTLLHLRGICQEEVSICSLSGIFFVLRSAILCQKSVSHTAAVWSCTLWRRSGTWTQEGGSGCDFHFWSLSQKISV